MTHACAVPGCAIRCDEKYLMCRADWRLVPAPLQLTVWRLWNSGKPKPGYWEARQAAIDAVVAVKMKGPEGRPPGPGIDEEEKG